MYEHIAPRCSFVNIPIADLSGLATEYFSTASLLIRRIRVNLLQPPLFLQHLPRSGPGKARVCQHTSAARGYLSEAGIAYPYAGPSARFGTPKAVLRRS